MRFLKLNIQLFGASASNSTTLTASSGNKGTLSTSFVENSSDTSTNKSNITVTATFKMTSGGYSQYNTPRVEIWWYDNNGYSTITRKAYTEATSLARNQSVTATATFDVDHKADGTLSGYARANWVYSGGYPYCPPSGEVATENTALTTILRGIMEISNITCSTSYIDGTFTVTANPQASGKYYKIEWYIINQSGNKYTICTDNLGTFATGSRTIQSKTFTSTQLTNIYANCTNTANPTLYAVVHTYNDSGYTSEILSTAPKTISINLPTSVKPSGSVTIADTVTKPSGLTSYVRSISKPKFTISITNNNGATISSCVIKLNGSQIKAFDNAATSYTYTHTETLPNVSNSYEVVATDTRNRQYVATGTITALDYSAPSVHFTAERNSTTDTTINLVINGSITSLSSKNAKSYLIQKKLSSASTWDTVTTLTDYTYTNYAYNITGCSADNIFDIKITATDSFGSSSDSTQVGTSFSLMDFKQGGTGVAFGKASEKENTVEFAINTEFQKPVTFNNTIKGKRFNASGTGYMKLFTITINGANYVQAMTFDLIQKNRSASGRIILKASTATSPVTNGFMLNQFYCEGTSNLYYCYNNSSNPSSVDIYVQKYDTSDDIEITNFKLGEYNSNVVITWAGTRVASLPTGYGSASRRAGQYQYGVTSTGTNNSDSNLMTSSGVKKAIINYVYPVGSFYYSTSSTNPSSTLGGTWVEKPCNKIISSGNITDTNISFCTYKIYGNGEYEINGLTTTYSLAGGTGRLLTINLPFTITTMVANISMAYGGNYYASTNRYCYGSGSTINIHEWNDAGGQADWLQDAFSCKGTLDLANNNLTRVYCFQRTA